MFTAVMFTYFGSLKAVSIFEFDWVVENRVYIDESEE